MQTTGKLLLIPILLLFSAGAIGQTAMNGHAGGVHASPITTSAVVPAQLLGPASIFMSRLQKQGLVDHAFMRSANANLVESPGLCPGGTFSPEGCPTGLVCCDCVGLGHRCESLAECQFQCTE
jgi:hypothetical protein